MDWLESIGWSFIETSLIKSVSVALSLSGEVDPEKAGPFLFFLSMGGLGGIIENLVVPS
jgi:hypothetical protein